MCAQPCDERPHVTRCVCAACGCTNVHLQETWLNEANTGWTSGEEARAAHMSLVKRPWKGQDEKSILHKMIRKTSNANRNGKIYRILFTCTQYTGKLGCQLKLPLA